MDLGPGILVQSHFPVLHYKAIPKLNISCLCGGNCLASQAISSFLNALVEVILAQEQKQQNSSFMYSLQDASRPSPEHFMS